MPPPLLFDLSNIDLDRLIVTKDQILKVNPQRHEFEQLDGIIHFDPDKQIILGLRDIKADEWWTKAHLPGRPLFPGVLMIEAAAQMASYITRVTMKDRGFLGFAGVDKVKFREAIVPPAKMYLLGRAVEMRARRTVCDTQGIVDGKLVFEARITGMHLD